DARTDLLRLTGMRPLSGLPDCPPTAVLSSNMTYLPSGAAFAADCGFQCRSKSPPAPATDRGNAKKAEPTSFTRVIDSRLIYCRRQHSRRTGWRHACRVRLFVQLSRARSHRGEHSPPARSQTSKPGRIG